MTEKHDEKGPIGRPLKFDDLQDEAMDNYSIRMTAWHARMARRIGSGNQGEGVRKSIEFVIRNEKSKK